jgi:hypothetical protein
MREHKFRMQPLALLFLICVLLTGCQFGGVPAKVSGNLAVTTPTATHIIGSDNLTQNPPEIMPLTTPANLDEPSKVVDAFLNNLVKDPSGSEDMAYTTIALREVIDHGHTILELLGLSTMYQSFGITASQIREDGQQATVQVELNLTSPVEREFSLVKVEGNWRINTVISYNIPEPNIFSYYQDANNLILDYYQALSDKDSHLAWSLLDGSMQETLTAQDLADQANTVDRITVTNLELTSDLEDRLVYHVLLWVSPNPDHRSEWSDGQNECWMEVVPTDNGWAITHISTTPIS